MQPRQVWRHHGGVNAVAFSPDGKWMASAGAKRAEVALQDRHTLCTARVLSGHEKPVCSIAFSADSTRLATGDGKGTIRLWNVVTASEVLVIGAHKGRITALDFTPDGNRVVSASMDKTIRFWDTHEGTQTLLISDLKSRAQDLAITPDGKELITAGAPPDSWLRVWNAATREFLRTVGGYGGGGHGYTCVDVSPDGRLVAAGGNCGVCVRERTTGKTVAGFAEHSHVVESVAFLAHERVLSSGYDGAARVLDVRKSRQVLRFRKSGHRTVPVPEGDGFAAFDSGRQLRLWSLPSDDVHTMSGRIPVFSTSGGELATVHGDSAVVIRDTLNWLPVDALPAAKSEVLALGFSPNDKTLAMGCANGSIRPWHRGSADAVREVQAHDGEVGQVSFSPTGISPAAGQYQQLVLPAYVHGDYRLRVKCRHETGRQIVAVNIPVDVRVVRLALGRPWKSDYRSGLDSIRGKSGCENETSVQGFHLMVGLGCTHPRRLRRGRR